ncbi:MAG: hypothetical protein LCH80_23460 [Proteobacteria bacterium]|nr:hypothetical protein [Pseudomonadota bacterium]
MNDKTEWASFEAAGESSRPPRCLVACGAGFPAPAACAADPVRECDALDIDSGDLFAINLEPGRLTPRCAVPLTIIRPSGEAVAITPRAAIETSLEITLLKSGGLIPHVLGGLLSSRSP